MLNFYSSAVYSELSVFYRFTIFHSKLFTLPLTWIYQQNGRTLSGKLRRSIISHHFLSNNFDVLSLHTPFYFLSALSFSLSFTVLVEVLRGSLNVSFLALSSFPSRCSFKMWVISLHVPFAIYSNTHTCNYLFNIFL